MKRTGGSRTGTKSNRLSELYRRRADAEWAALRALPEAAEQDHRGPHHGCRVRAIDPGARAYAQGEPPSTTIGAETLWVLASLTEQIAVALDDGNLLLAAELAALHRAQVEAHLDGCLAALLRSLEASPNATAVGASALLAKSFADDLDFESERGPSPNGALPGTLR
jgi:hypothetical protein